MQRCKNIVFTVSIAIFMMPCFLGTCETIRFWHPFGGPGKLAVEQCCSEYEAAHKGIHIEPLYISDMQQKLMLATAADIAPEIAVINRPQLARWAAEGALMALDIADPGIWSLGGQFYSNPWNEVQYDGHIWALPYNFDDRALFWNKKLFRESGLDPDRPPQTLEEFELFANKTSRKGDDNKYTVLGFYPLWGNAHFYMYAFPRNVEFFSPDGRQSRIDQPRVLETFGWLLKWREKYGVDQIQAFQAGFGVESQTPLAQGRVAMMVDGSWMIDYYKRYNPELDFGVAPMPAPEGSQILTWSAGFAVALPRNCKNVKESLEFMKYITSTQTQTMLVNQYGIMPANREAGLQTRLSKSEEWTVMVDLLDRSSFLPHTPVLEELDVIIARCVEEVMVGGIAPAVAVKEADKKFQDALNGFFANKNKKVDWHSAVKFFMCVLTAALFGWAVFLGKSIKASPMRRSEYVWGYLFASPWLIGLVALGIGPIVVSFLYAFMDYPILNDAHWAGFNNFYQLFAKDKLFLKCIYNTFYYAFFSVPLIVGLSLFLAVLLNQKIMGTNIYRLMFYLPSVVSGVAMCVVFMWIFNPTQGLLNAALESLGVPGPGWLTSVTWSKPAIILMSLWGCGGAMVIFMAALQAVPAELEEAAMVDGAGHFGRFWHVIVPQISHAIFFNTLMGFIGAFQVFTQSYVMTNGGPLDSTNFYAFYLFRQAFQYFHMGYASAMAWVLFVIVAIFTIVQFMLGRKFVYYDH